MNNPERMEETWKLYSLIPGASINITPSPKSYAIIQGTPEWLLAEAIVDLVTRYTPEEE